jgi:hypothetical protein
MKEKIKKAEKIRRTTKAAVLEGDPNCPDVVAFSVYNTKPIHFLSTNISHLDWKRTKIMMQQQAIAS